MKSKFDEFYYENDAKNHPASEYWELYDKNPREAQQVHRWSTILCVMIL